MTENRADLAGFSSIALGGLLGILGVSLTAWLLVAVGAILLAISFYVTDSLVFTVLLGLLAAWNAFLGLTGETFGALVGWLDLGAGIVFAGIVLLDIRRENKQKKWAQDALKSVGAVTLDKHEIPK